MNRFCLLEEVGFNRGVGHPFAVLNGLLKNAGCLSPSSNCKFGELLKLCLSFLSVK